MSIFEDQEVIEKSEVLNSLFQTLKEVTESIQRKNKPMQSWRISRLLQCKVEIGYSCNDSVIEMSEIRDDNPVKKFDLIFSVTISKLKPGLRKILGVTDPFYSKKIGINQSVEAKLSSLVKDFQKHSKSLEREKTKIFDFVDFDLGKIMEEPDAEEESSLCLMCQTSGSEKDLLQPCGHDLCMSCVDKWVSVKKVIACPLCHIWEDYKQPNELKDFKILSGPQNEEELKVFSLDLHCRLYGFLHSYFSDQDFILQN